MKSNVDQLVREGMRATRRRGGRSVTEAVRAGGIFTFEQFRRGRLIDRWQDHNLAVDQGLNSLLNVNFNAATQISTWYIGLFEGNYTPVAADTAAGFPAAATECTAYTEATRVVYNEAISTAKSITNSASVAVFTINATKTIYGAFLTSASAKSATTGTLMAATRFAVARSVINLDVLNVTYTFNLSAS